MSKGIVAKRYAVALFQLAKEQHALDQFEGELRTVKQVFAENEDFLTVLSNPKLSIDRKKLIVKEAFTSFSQTTLNTLCLLLDRHREELILDVADEFIELANNERGIAEAKVFSIRPLSEDEKAGLSSVFAAKVGKASLKIENVVDKSLIGGVKLRIGNQIFDGSVKGKLERLERELIAKR
ncbi:F0F1 ATP synthase subunit delta [Fredinandcohnia quinoae]|uniref:ATP synthase subunit delta n=1 Tax=Fredinandcohnia quinoae TaxID=2918902 RepID=A0AAW5E0N3_9BACI|nr:F0F1 ATP synthase subunit delta [Fredinandcohnia sp. SECRCQ15]MCH1625139.1 F0F1 ATP synthase subunit delta [Fredinandcohnia sp. SECRCQ15]